MFLLFDNHVIDTVVLEYFTSDYDAKCRLDTCKTYPAITDQERGEIVCGECGTVLLQNIPDVEHEAYSSQDDFMSQTRTGPGMSLAMHDKGLSTVIGNNRDSAGNNLSRDTRNQFSRLRIWDQRSKSKTVVRLSKAFTILNALKTKLAIPDTVVEDTAQIYRKAVAAKLTRGRTMRSLVAASLYAACRQSSTLRSLDDIVKAANIEKRILSRDFRTLVSRLELNVDQYDTAVFITKICNNLDMKETTKRQAVDFLKKCEERGITEGKNPIVQAASCVYIACVLNGEKISQNQISRVAAVSSVAIRNRTLLIKEELGI
ncbi:transcription initiation factor TFIIIB [Nitrosopumilus sp. b1]|uniref:transcription initiation factor IIB n=1 Tax=Nitrosopumilus sp. b1 TaxID=2109907 RepID=UPI00210212A2|nr:transcription initiation factor TFIIIB [Nitrosopumilus sp. b1]